MMRTELARYLIILLLSFGLSVEAQARCDRSTFRIVLDVGHSPSSPGAISARGLTEYSYNLALATAIEAHLISRGYSSTTRMVTEGPHGNLDQRSARANSLAANLFLSVHHDSVQTHYLEAWNWNGRAMRFCDRFRGWSIFVSQTNPRAAESVDFARRLGERLLAYGLPFSRHHAEAIRGESRPFIDPTRGVYRFDDLRVLKSTWAPAVLLEAGIIVNRSEEEAVSSPRRQAAVAQAVGEATDSFCEATSAR